MGNMLFRVQPTARTFFPALQYENTHLLYDNIFWKQEVIEVLLKQSDGEREELLCLGVQAHNLL